MELSDKEGMIQKVIGLLFFSLLLVLTAAADDYVIQKGDTAGVIAQKKKIPTEVLKRANPELDLEKLKAGESLSLPERYSVKAGDTLYSLSRLWKVDLALVLEWNGLTAASVLKAGQTLFVPFKSRVVVGPFWPVEKKPHAEEDKLKAVTFSTTGEPFRSVSAGTVIYQGEFRGVGRVLMVQAEDKVVFAYGNYESSLVEYGQAVTKGQVLGNTSPRTSQKLSFFAFKQNESLDVFAVKR